MKKHFCVRIFAAILCLILLLGALAGCGGKKDDGKIRIVTTVFPIYDWVRQVVGESDHIEIDMLLDSGVDLHSYSPTVSDMVSISTCDLFLYIGGESDDWVKDALKSAKNESRIVVNLMEALGDAVKEEELVEGMEEHEHEEEEHDEEEVEYDEHIWLSLKNASLLVNVICDAVCRLDEANAASYRSNAEAYRAKLDRLDGEYEAAVSAGNFRTLVFADRFPFRYLADDYGLSYFAAFSGCSAESEASVDTVLFLARKVDELGLRSILQIESADGKIARTVREATESKDQIVLTMDSLQSVTAEKLSSGVTYLSVMEANLAVLRQALQ